MVYNATIRRWFRQTGTNKFGGAVYAQQPGGPWPCCSEPGGQRLVRDPGGASTPVDRVVFVDRMVAFVAGDKVEMEDGEYRVLESALQPGALQHVRLLLGNV